MANTEGADRQIPIEGDPGSHHPRDFGTYIEVSIPFADWSK
jgi:hypothetical protein